VLQPLIIITINKLAVYKMADSQSCYRYEQNFASPQIREFLLSGAVNYTRASGNVVSEILTSRENIALKFYLIFEVVKLQILNI
jgi:hypothetical protein